LLERFSNTDTVSSMVIFLTLLLMLILIYDISGTQIYVFATKRLCRNSFNS
jgi:hypothetical protein